MTPAAASVPGSSDRRAAPGVLDDLANPAVRGRRPRTVLRPRSFRDVRRVLAELPPMASISVIGGGHSPRSVQDDEVCLDLRAIPRRAVLRPDGALEVNGSAVVADLLAASAGRAVPVGTSGGPGMGLLTTGGIGALSRSHGLAVDALLEVDLILADGSVRRVGPQDSGLWWAVRGAAPRLGVVSRAVLRTWEAGPLDQVRLVAGPQVLAAWCDVAEQLPRTVNLSWTAYPSPHGPSVLLVEVAQDGAGGTVDSLAPAPLYRIALRHRFGEYLEPEIPLAQAPRQPPGELLWAKSCLLLDRAGLAAVAERLLDAIDSAPTVWCRIDGQHLGGAVADIDDAATAFHGRGALASVTVMAAWPAGGPHEAPLSWLSQVDAMLSAVALARHASEAQPQDPAPWMEQTFGAQLPRLRYIADRIDPAARFRFAPPFLRPDGHAGG